MTSSIIRAPPIAYLFIMFRLTSSFRLLYGIRQKAACGFPASVSTTALHRAKSTEDNGNKKIYEFRTYAIRPDKFGECMKIIENNIHVRTAHSKLVGFWITDLGGINEVYHLWEFDSYQHRTDVRRALTLDRNWNECLSKIRPMFVSQTNVILNAFPWYKLRLEPRQGFGFYELVIFHLKPGYLSEFAHRTLQGLPDRLEMDYPHPLGFWFTEFGQSNQQVVSIWPHKNLEKRARHREELFQIESWKETTRDTSLFFNDITVKAMVPAPFSPIQ